MFFIACEYGSAGVFASEKLESQSITPPHWPVAEYSQKKLVMMVLASVGVK